MMKHLDALLLVRLACLLERAGVMMVLPEGAISTCVLNARRFRSYYNILQKCVGLCIMPWKFKDDYSLQC